MGAEVPPPSRDGFRDDAFDVHARVCSPQPIYERARDAPTRSGVEICNLRTNERPRYPVRQRGKSREETPKEGKFSMHGACQLAVALSRMMRVHPAFATAPALNDRIDARLCSATMSMKVLSHRLRSQAAVCRRGAPANRARRRRALTEAECPFRP
jgi:hypothetical protein